MTVLHIDEQSGWRGGEQQASWVIRALLERGDRVILAGRRNSAFLDADYGPGNWVRVSLPFVGEWDLWSAWRLSRLACEYEVQIFHAQTSHAHLYACLARQWSGRGKVVVSRRVSFPPGKNPITRWKYKLPDRIIAVSQRVADVLLESGVDAPRVTVVHSAIDLARLDVTPLSRAELGIPDGVPLVGTAGALVGHKDHATFLDAIAKVRTAYPAVRALIAGEGELRTALEQQMRRLQLDDCVTMLGHRADAPRLIRALDVYVSSSWSEGLGTSVLEAMAANVPVAATIAGGVPEMIEQERTGLLVPARNPDALADAIIRLLADRSLAMSLAAQALNRVHEQFTVDKMIAGNLRVYNELLSS